MQGENCILGRVINLANLGFEIRNQGPMKWKKQRHLNCLLTSNINLFVH